MDKEAVLCIYNGILLSHQRECIWVSADEVDEHKAYWEQTYGHDWGGEGGEGGMYGESNMETYITMCKIDSQWEFAVWLRELRLGLSNNLEKWDAEGGGMDVQVERDTGKPMVTFSRNQHNAIKQSSFKYIYIF